MSTTAKVRQFGAGGLVLLGACVQLLLADDAGDYVPALLLVILGAGLLWFDWRAHTKRGE